MYKKEISDFIYAHKNDMTELLKRLIAIPSIRGEAAEDMPYGKAVDDVLRLARKEAEVLGLSSENFENRMTLINLNDKKTNLGILCHLDVVPVNEEKWTYPPFSGTVVDDVIYGRGASDNKGAAVSVLYAMYAIKKLGINLKNNACLYLGGDEENGGSDLIEYLKKHSLPEYNFTADGNFPVGNAETGRIVIKKTGKASSENVVSVKAGEALNIIPSTAEIVFKDTSEQEIAEVLSQLPDIKYELKTTGDEIECTIFGKSTHAAHPQQGINSLTAAIYLISKTEPENELFSGLARVFKHNKFRGEGFGLIDRKLVLSVTNMTFGEGNYSFAADCRPFPGECAEKLSEEIRKNIAFEVEIEHREPHYVAEDSTLVSALQKVYCEHMNCECKPYTMDGNTYAQFDDNAVIFGAEIPGNKSGNIHGNDECFDLNTMLDAAIIFAMSIIELCGVC